MRKKRYFILLIAISTMLFFSACGGKREEEVNVTIEKIDETPIVQVDNDASNEIIKEENESIVLGNTYKVPLKELYIDIPNMKQIEAGYTEVFYERNVKYITFTCLKTATATDEKDALKVVFDELKLNMSGLDIINHMGEITEEYLTVNDIEVYSFEGTLNCGLEPVYDAYMKGYSFVYEDMPCAIIGVVMDETQPQEQINAVKELVDAMILTVRSEK